MLVVLEQLILDFFSQMCLRNIYIFFLLQTIISWVLRMNNFCKNGKDLYSLFQMLVHEQTFTTSVSLIKDIGLIVKWGWSLNVRGQFIIYIISQQNKGLGMVKSNMLNPCFNQRAPYTLDCWLNPMKCTQCVWAALVFSIDVFSFACIIRVLYTLWNYKRSKYSVWTHYST